MRARASHTRPKRFGRSVAMALLASALLAACSPDPEPRQDTASHPATDTAQGAMAPDALESAADAMAPSPGVETTAGGGADIQLDALTGQDITKANLSGELACSFSVDDEAPVLFATGFVASDEPAQGIVKVSGVVEPIRAPGGFDGILRDPTFTGKDKTITIALTGEAIGGGESPPRPATLTYQRADGASRRFDGRWQCGP